MNDWERLHRQAERYKQSYPPGTRVMLLNMNDPYSPVESGMRGTVQSVDDIGQLLMKWDTEMIASKKEWEFAGLYADEGISGTRADKRPQFQKMINDCHKGKIDMIITKSVSRFARNTIDCIDYVRSLKEIGVGIYFEEQNIDTLKIDSELYLVIYAGFAQSESESISKNITWTHRKNFEEGRPIFTVIIILR